MRYMTPLRRLWHRRKPAAGPSPRCLQDATTQLDRLNRLAEHLLDNSQELIDQVTSLEATIIAEADALTGGRDRPPLA